MKWCLKHTGICSVNIVIPIEDKWNVVELKTKKLPGFPKALVTKFIFVSFF